MMDNFLITIILLLVLFIVYKHFQSKREAKQREILAIKESNRAIMISGSLIGIDLLSRFISYRKNKKLIESCDSIKLMGEEE